MRSYIENSSAHAKNSGDRSLHCCPPNSED
jgi:hypothetical protein